MKNTAIVCSLLIVVLLSGVDGWSQGEFQLHLGPNLPVSDFGDDDYFENEEAGGAGPGILAGLQYVHTLQPDGLAIFGGLDISYNGLQGDVKDDFEDFTSRDRDDINYPEYFNIPVSAGLIYQFQTAGGINLIAKGGLALNFLKITPIEIENGIGSGRQEHELATHPGFRLGGGVGFSKFALLLEYYGLGEHEVESEVEAPGFSESFDFELGISYLSLTAYFRL